MDGVVNGDAVHKEKGVVDGGDGGDGAGVDANAGVGGVDAVDAGAGVDTDAGVGAGGVDGDCNDGGVGGKGATRTTLV